MSHRAVAVVPLAALAILSGGCGTFVNHCEPGSYFNAGAVAPHQPYGGVVADLKVVGMNAARVVGDDKNYDPYSAAGMAAVYLFLDLPMSAVADTLLLPLDVTNTLRGRGEPPPGGWPLLRQPEPVTD